MSGKIAVRWIGPCEDTSGYASATRGYLNALVDNEEVDLSITPITFEAKHVGHGSSHKRIKDKYNKPLAHKIQVSHATPENYNKIKGMGKYNVCYVAWECSLLPSDWVPLINQMDEVWVPSGWNREVFHNSGVTKPVYVIPHVIKMPDLSDMKTVDMGVPDDTFVFYSIFQWINRKAPDVLLKAYLTEFKASEKVCLALKTYRLNDSAPEQQIVKQDIANIKTSLNLKEYPQLRFFGSILPAENMKGFYNRGDCFVLPSRGEGFSITHATAMSYGKPVIGPSYGGSLDFMDEENSYLVRCHESPVSGMIFPNYCGHMNWGEPEVGHLKEIMRRVFENREEAAEKGKRARSFIEKNLNAEYVSGLIVDRLREISKRLK